MSEEFKVVRCSSCELFQVQIPQKHNNVCGFTYVEWVCNGCGMLQELKWIWGKGESFQWCNNKAKQLNKPQIHAALSKTLAARNHPFHIMGRMIERLAERVWQGDTFRRRVGRLLIYIFLYYSLYIYSLPLFLLFSICCLFNLYCSCSIT